MASPLSSTQSGNVQRDDSLNRSPHTPSPRKLKRLQSAQTDEQHNESKCKRCGWRYPIPNPHYRERRDHKKICPNRYSSVSAEGKLGSEDIGRSGDYGGLAQSESGDSGLTGDQDVIGTGKSSRRSLSFGEVEQEQVTQKEVEREHSPSEEPGTARDKVKAGSSSVPMDSGQNREGTGKRKVEVFQGKELGLQHAPTDVRQDTHSPRSGSDLETGSDSELSSAVTEHETDPSDDEFESSEIGDAVKREESLPSLTEGALQHQHPDAEFKGGAESSHASEKRTDSEGEGKPTNVASLITKYEQGQRSPPSLPSDVAGENIAIAGDKRSSPFAKNGGTEQLSLTSKDQRKVGEITPAEETVEGGRLSTARGGVYDLEHILKKQKTHDLICPVCGSQITDRIILRKRRRTFVGKDESSLPNLKEITAETANQDQDVKALTAGAGSHRETWVQRCWGYFSLFRNDS